MNPHYHWLTEGMELITFFFIAPALAFVIAYKTWRERANPKQYGMRCIAFGGAALVLFGVAKWLDADIGAPQYFLQLACVLLGFLFLGVCVGCFFSVLLHMWYWHKSTPVT
jgi:peptidoglycan/LPS O-acetylase OafA/YrhL